MDPSLYMAAMKGNIAFLLQNKDQFEEQLTVTKNTVLHVTALFHDSAENVREILNVQPSLLCRLNSRNETVLHIAARKGQTNTVEALIAFAKTLGQDPESIVRITKEMLRMTNEEKDTALHEAVRGNHVGVVKLLVEEDKEFPCGPNSYGETPLYLAAERNYCEIVSAMLSTRNLPAYGGPNGRTALHAAVFADCLGCMKGLLYREPNLAKEADLYGWTPLHCAARINSVQCTQELLQVDKSAACLTADGDEKNTALHIAARWGRVKAMKEILIHCPDCWEMVNGRGQNILHVAVFFDKLTTIRFILKKPWVKNLLNYKDMDGNSPLHILAGCYYTPLDLLRNGKLELIRHPVGDKGSFNKENLTPLDIASRGSQDPIKKELLKVHAPQGWRNIVQKDSDQKTQWMKSQQAKQETQVKSDPRKLGENMMVVATLIATVTFAAGFTLPGGYDGNKGPNQGMAVLMTRAAFKVFVISDTIAMVSSISALFLILLATFYLDQQKVSRRYAWGFWLILMAIVGMTIAFITGMYAVLANPLGFGLAIMVCVFGCYAILIEYGFVYRLFWDIFHNTLLL